MGNLEWLEKLKSHDAFSNIHNQLSSSTRRKSAKLGAALQVATIQCVL